MKKNIVLSSVAAVAVAGMLVLSGCGGNSGSTKNNDNVAAGETAKFSVIAGEPATVTVGTGSTRKDRGQSDVKVTVKSITCGEENTEEACKTKCPADGCAVTITAGCGVVNANNELVDGTSAAAASKAFAELAGSGQVIADGEFVGFDGVTVLTSDDVNSCTIDYSTFITCALDKAGQKFYVSKDAPYGDETGAAASEVIVQITTVDADGKKTTTWQRVDLAFTTKVVDGKEVQGQPYVELKNLALNGNLPATIKVFTVMKKAGSKAHGSKVTGVSGGTGATGGSGSGE